MELKTYLSKIPKIDRPAFAAKCGSTVGHLTNIAYGYKPCGEKLATAIEIKSEGLVTRKELRPHDWRDIWPELIGSDS